MAVTLPGPSKHPGRKGRRRFTKDRGPPGPLDAFHDLSDRIDYDPAHPGISRISALMEHIKGSTRTEYYDAKAKRNRRELKSTYLSIKEKDPIPNEQWWVCVAVAAEDWKTAGEISIELNKFMDAEQYLMKSGMGREDACRMIGESCMAKGFFVYAASFFKKSGDRDKEGHAKSMKTGSPVITDMLKEDKPNPRFLPLSKGQAQKAQP